MQKILVTGASGYIAKHIVLTLLKSGYSVRGSVRSDKRADEVRAAMTAHLGEDPGERLEFCKLDLLADDGWSDALQGVDGLFHTASPFILEMPKDENDLIRPAVDGTLRALKAANAAGVMRVILTSSVVAIAYTDKPAGKAMFDENDWTDVNSAKVSAYDKSKTLAERAAWDYVKDTDVKLTTINPGLVLGEPLDVNYGASLSVIERFLRGKDPMVPNSGLSVVDVKDIATMHVKAFETDASIGERIAGVSGWCWFRELTAPLKEALPHRKIPTRVAPNFLLKILAMFDSTLRSLIPHLGLDESISNAKAKELLGMTFIDTNTSIVESGNYVDGVIN